MLARNNRQNIYFTTPSIIEDLSQRDTFSKFLKQSIAIGLALLILTSFAPSTLLETGVSAYEGDDTDFIEGEALPWDQPAIVDDGFVLKENSTTLEEVNRLGVTDKVIHMVEKGETLSEIAQRYSISVETLMWENNLYEKNRLQVGQSLIIPPLNGVTHTVMSDKETLNKIAKLYNVDSVLIKEHNHLEGDVVKKSQKLFIPGGKLRVEENTGRDRSVRQKRSPVNTFDLREPRIATGETPAQGKSLIYPTIGKASQGFRGGHYAIDIANSSQPDVWSAALGKIIDTGNGCPSRVEKHGSCNGGRGNYINIDHGNGLQTAYFHLETIYVEKGQEVSQGQVLGKMGSSGRVFGKTGIHLHFEVIDKGVKRNPGNYF